MTPLANTRTPCAVSHRLPARMGKVTLPAAFVPALTCRVAGFQRYGSVGLSAHTVKSGHAVKSRTTFTPPSGVLFRSRTTIVNGMSPSGHAVRHWGTVELLGSGTPATAGPG